MAKWVVRRSGGILILLKLGFFTLNFSFRGEGFVGISVDWQLGSYFIVNVYSSYLLLNKRKLWMELKDFRDRYIVGEWCIRGDFNVIKKKGERKGVGTQINKSEILEFSQFIENLEFVVEVPLMGSRYTWFNFDGSDMSRLYKFLIVIPQF